IARYCFGPFQLDPVEGTLTRNGMRIRIQDLPFRLLLLLVERPDVVITREEVRQRLWPGNTFLEFDNSLGVAIRKVRESLNDSAESPQYVATVPRRGFRFVAPVQVEMVEEPQVAVPPLSPPAVRGTRRWNPLFLGLGGLGLLGLIGWGVLGFRSAASRPSQTQKTGNPPRVQQRRSVAVWGFRNLPGRPEDDWLSPVFSEMLDTDLGTHGDLRMVSGEDVARVKHQLPNAEGTTLAKATLARLRENPGADVVVIGSYTPLPGKDEQRIRLDVRAQDTADGETIAEEAITGDRNGLFDLGAQAAARLRSRLGLTPNSSREASEARLALPANPQSARLYVEGRDKLWAFDFPGARNLLLQAVSTDPQFPLAHSALSEAWWHLGYAEKARSEAQQARQLAHNLTQEDRLLIEGQYWRSIPDWPKAVQAYRDLFRLFPDSLDYGLLLASAQMNVQASAALETLATLRSLPAPASEDARIDMTEASAWITQDLSRARAAAMSAIDKGRAQGNSVLVARTYAFLCQQASATSSTEQALADCENARQSAVAARDRNAEAMMVTDIADIYYQHGDLARAGSMFSRAIEEFRVVGNPDGIAAAMSDLGAIRLTQGNLSEAKKLLQESIPNYQAAADIEGMAISLDNLGDLARQSGDLPLAETNYQQARIKAENIESKSAAAYVLMGMGDLYKDRGDIAQARKSYESSLALRRQLGDRQTMGESQVALAVLSVEDGRAGEGEKTLREWKEQFHTERQADDELAASVGLTIVLLAQGRAAEAQKEVDGAKELAAKSQNALYRLQYELTSVRVLLESDRRNLCAPRLHNILREAHERRFAGTEFEAMLAAAELEKRSGHAAVAREHLTSLENAARGKGFVLVARKAAAARGAQTVG
ncbi:MAG: tetratricopeptide repeat protein, partial [Acidobacteriaceae bacterium]